MNGLLQPCLRVPLTAALAAFIGWILLPGTALDRAAFKTVARSTANPPFFITGEGSHANPWKLRTFASKQRLDPKRAPLIVSLGDDPEGFFQSSPPSPIDFAVILSNFQRLGAGKAATAAVLAWDKPDPIGLAALDKTLGRFDSLVMAAPLTRGAVAEPMPAAFRNASVSVSRIHGDITSLPVVNRVPLPGVILGKENTRAGFQTLDSEPASRFAPLLARWDDRVVFAFPLLAAMQGLDLPLDGIEIRLGEYLKLSPQGPVVPLDRFGRLALPLGQVTPFAEIAADALIDGGDDLFPKQAPEPVILRDDHSAAEPATRAFSGNLAPVIAAIASDTGLAPARVIARFTCCQEIVLLSLLIAALKLISLLPSYPRNIAFVLLAGFCLTAQILATASAVWLPWLAAFAAIATTFVVCKLSPSVTTSPVNPPS
ncbi:MAG: hypothetical protein EHM17_06970 [Verrucomicrobiaceae bacterium]|nr:MAG: hypothetical protein EHM17_06970 [Verrucomicrobiaceae bacterium]